ncbi:helix-turn-helix domain-containing protein [Streptomyces rochei]|uniref:helix-turn-helix domain-containing protein n=1 Tax=Streptomyces rochei TaxID=1928 RepID=UPI00381E396C
MTARHHPDEQPIPEIAKAIEWAEQHLHQKFSVEDLAARAHVSRSTFQRHFHTVTGAAPLEWLTARRLDRAKYLLETTDLPIRAIARRSGFRGESLFRYHWRRLMDGTPSGWRREHSTGRRAD